MNNLNDPGRELGWEDEIENEGSPRVVLEPGEYPFTVQSFERARFAGSEKVPPCPQAVVHLQVNTPEGPAPMNVNLLLHSRFEWKLCAFFLSLGLRKHNEKLRMNWPATVGRSGRCKITKNKYTDRSGVEREGNEVEFLDPIGAPSTPPAGGFTPGAF